MSIPYPPGMTFRPMQSNDVRSVLRIIAQVDEDDHENAQATYRRGLRGHYVLTENDEVIGVIGAQEAEGTDRAWWLSWTYLDEAHRGSGLGALLLEALFEQLEQWDARKIFVNTSDYFDLEEGRVYEDALAAYQRVGFVEELRHRDYYDRDETLITLGLRLQPADEAAVAAPTHQQLARPTGYDEISETEGAYYIDWEFSDDPAGGMQAWEATVREIAKMGGRVVFVGVAEDAEGVSRLVRQAGFKEAGRLTDFYEDGIDEIHFRYDLL